jgi:hypothetical protein
MTPFWNDENDRSRLIDMAVAAMIFGALIWFILSSLQCPPSLHPPILLLR